MPTAVSRELMATLNCERKGGTRVRDLYGKSHRNHRSSQLSQPRGYQKVPAKCQPKLASSRRDLLYQTIAYDIV
jgi:hypothetical protein